MVLHLLRCTIGLKNMQIFYPIRSKTKSNRGSLARVFPRFVSCTCHYYESWLVHCIVYDLCDWQKPFTLVLVWQHKNTALNASLYFINWERDSGDVTSSLRTYNNSGRMAFLLKDYCEGDKEMFEQICWFFAHCVSVRVRLWTLKKTTTTFKKTPLCVE